MDFRLTPEQQQLRDAARRFARAELPALAKQLEATNEPVPKAMVKQYGALGFLGVNLPEAYGGHGAGHLEAVICLEELARISPAVAFPLFESSFGPILAIAHFASDELRKRLIPAVCAGDVTVAVSMIAIPAATIKWCTARKIRAPLSGLSGSSRRYKRRRYIALL